MNYITVVDTKDIHGSNLHLVVASADFFGMDVLASSLSACANRSLRRVGFSERCMEYLMIGGLEHFLFFHILGIIIPTD